MRIRIHITAQRAYYSNGHCKWDGGGQWGLSKIWKTSAPRKVGALADPGFPKKKKKKKGLFSSSKSIFDLKNWFPAPENLWFDILYVIFIINSCIFRKMVARVVKRKKVTERRRTEELDALATGGTAYETKIAANRCIHIPRGAHFFEWDSSRIEQLSVKWLYSEKMVKCIIYDILYMVNIVKWFSEYWISGPPPPPFSFVPLYPSLAVALAPLSFFSRSARPPSRCARPLSSGLTWPTETRGLGYKNDGRGGGQKSNTVIEPL